MTFIPVGKACVNSVNVMVLVSMGRRVTHPRVAVKGRRSRYRLRIRVSLCVVAACAPGSISNHVYDATAWLDLSNTSTSLAIPTHSSIRCSGLFGSMNSGMFARKGGIVRLSGTIHGVWMSHREAFAEVLLLGRLARAVPDDVLLGARCVRALMPVCEGKMWSRPPSFGRPSEWRGLGFC